MIKLYHYSDKDIDKILRVSFFGVNSYSLVSKRLSNTKRLYFYTNKQDREEFFIGAEFLYIIDIDEKNLYDLDKDTLKINNYTLAFDELLERIKKEGYQGVLGSNGYNIVILFNDVQFNEKINLLKALTK